MTKVEKLVMNVKSYVGDLIGASLLITESRIIAKYLLEKPTDGEWYSLVVEQNILQKKSSQTAVRYTRTIRHRFEGLGDDFIQSLVSSSEREYIQLLMVGLMIDSPIVVDFMRLSLAEARRVYKPTLASDAWTEFYNTQTRVHPEIGKFFESTVKKMGNNTIKALVDSGYLSDSRKRHIQPVYLLPEVKKWLIRLGKEDLIEVMECTI